MIIELFFSIKKLKDTSFEQTRAQPQETIQSELKKQRQTFSFDPPINLSEESQWKLARTLFEETKSVLNFNNENKSFSVTIPGFWTSRDVRKQIINYEKY